MGRSAIPPRIGTSRQSYGTPAHRQYGPLERKRISEDANSCRSRTVCAMILVKLLTIGYRATVSLALAFFVTMAVFLSGIHSGPADAHEQDPGHNQTHHVEKQAEGSNQPSNYNTTR